MKAAAKGVSPESERRLAALLGNLPGLVFRCRNDGNWTLEFVSGAVRQVTGYSAEELMAQPPPVTPFEMTHPDDRERVRALMVEAATAGRGYTVEYRLIGRDGIEKQVWERGSTVLAPDGRVEAMEGFVQDVTESRRSERELREANRKLQGVLDSMFAFVGLFELDGTVVEINRAPLEAAGLRREDVIGQPFAGTYWWAHSPAAQAQLRAALARAARGETVREDFTVQVAGGRVITLDGTFSPLRDADGGVAQIVGSAVDITERQQAEQQARQSERLRRLIIDTGPECVKVVGPDGSLTQMNPAGLAMLEAESLEQAQRCPLSEFVAPAHRAAFVDLHRRVMQGAQDRLEFEVTGLHGTRRWLETHAVPLRDERGAVTAMLGITRDITGRKLQDQRITRLSRMRAVMSSVNAMIVRTRSRTELFQEACRIAVEQGGFGLAAMAVRQENGDVVSVAAHGEDHGHLTTFRFSLEDESHPAVAPALRAFREGRPWVRNDLPSQGSVDRLRDPLRQLGYGSSVSYPLMVGGQMLACFNLYAREAGFFDEEELALLAELAGDLSYALEFILKDEKLDFLAIYDPLTRLPNRSLFMRRLPGFLQAAQDDGRRVALLVLDIERFKAINDATGQAGGDELLKRTGERLKFHAGGPSYMARIAGDRFAAVIIGIDRATDVEKLVQGGGWDRLDPPFQHGGQEFAVSLKIGIAVYPQDAPDAEALLRNAELALKHAKSGGRRLARYTAEMGDIALRKMQLGRTLRRALERSELVLHYQPKVDLRTGLVCGAEALLRWHSENGLVLPGSIVPLMEETGLILEVGRWVLQQAVEQRERWLADGLPVPRIGVNVSAVQLREKDFVETVRTVLARAPGTADGVELEVTESMMMADPDANIAMLRELREMGTAVSMDDFGTGYSSLAYLTRLPLNAVKIDRSFVDTMASSPETMNVVSTIIALAHSMNLRVVAEGVESEEQLQYLRVLRCDEMQGFLFSPALPPDEFAALLRAGRRLGG